MSRPLSPPHPRGWNQQSPNPPPRRRRFTGAVRTACLALCGALSVAASTGCETLVAAMWATAGHAAYVCSADEAVCVHIGPGALAEDTLITITETEVPAGLDPSQVALQVYDFGPDGLQFLEPVEVTIRPEQLPEGASLADLTLFNHSEDLVEALSDQSVDEDTGTLHGSTTHFSKFYGALGGPVGGRGIHVGGENLSPFFGSSGVSEDPPEVQIWVAPGGEIRTNPYSVDWADILVIQLNTNPPVLDSKLFIDGWTISPVDPGVVVGPTGDRISTSGFWFDFFQQHFINDMRNLVTDSQGRLILPIRGTELYSELSKAPPGISEGRLRLRVFASDGADAVDIILGITTTP